MAKKSITDSEVLRMARVSVTETAAATFTQQELDTQLSVERGVIWQIHFVEFFLNGLSLLREVAANAQESIDIQLTRTTQTGIVGLTDPDVLIREAYMLSRSAAIGTDAGPLYFYSTLLKRYEFKLPIPVASQSLFLGILGTAASAHTVSCRIGYNIEHVSDEYFFRVAQALVG